MPATLILDSTHETSFFFIALFIYQTCQASIHKYSMIKSSWNFMIVVVKLNNSWSNKVHMNWLDSQVLHEKHSKLFMRDSALKIHWTFKISVPRSPFSSRRKTINCKLLPNRPFFYLKYNKTSDIQKYAWADKKHSKLFMFDPALNSKSQFQDLHFLLGRKQQIANSFLAIFFPFTFRNRL